MDLRRTTWAGAYRVGLMDPPWRFSTWNGKRAVPARTAEDPYPTMSHDELAALPVGATLAPSSALFMWVVDSHLDQALDLGRALGFRYKTIAFIWDKGRMGFGYWTRKEGEICLLFTRGQIGRKIDATGVRQIIRAKPRGHSRKPDEQYPRIEKLLGGPYLEMFARNTPRPGWTAWGNEVGKF